MLSVDPTAKDLGCQDASKGADAAKQIIKDLVTQHPEVNLIYSEASNLTVGTMAGLTEAGRGKMDNGKPLTEIVASVDFDETEYKQVYDPNSSLKFSMGLPPLETGRGRIDLIMDVAAGKIPMTSRAGLGGVLQGLQHQLLDDAGGRGRDLAEHPVRHQPPGPRGGCTGG